MNLQELQQLQQQVLDASFDLHNAKKSLMDARRIAFASSKKFRVLNMKYELAKAEQEKIAYQQVVMGCSKLACSAHSITKL